MVDLSARDRDKRFKPEGGVVLFVLSASVHRLQSRPHRDAIGRAWFDLQSYWDSLASSRRAFGWRLR